MVFSSFFSRFGKNRKGVIGIDIGSSTIKIVHLINVKGVSTFANYSSWVLSSQEEYGKAVPHDEDKIVEDMKRTLKEMKVDTTTAGVSIPFRSSFTTLIEIPAVPDSEVAKIIPFEARKYIPVPISEVSLDFAPVPDSLLDTETELLEGEQAEAKIKNKPKTRKILLVAVHNNELKLYNNIFKRINLKLKFFEIEIFSTLRAISSKNHYPIMIIDIGTRITKYYILYKNVPIRSYSMTQGGQFITEAIMSAKGLTFHDAELLKRTDGLDNSDPEIKKIILSVLGEIFAETTNAINDFEERFQRNIGKIVFTGGGSSINGLLVEATKSIRAPVEIANPFSTLQYPLFMKDIFKQIGPEFTVAIGAALRGLENS